MTCSLDFFCVHLQLGNLKREDHEGDEHQSLLDRSYQSRCMPKGCWEEVRGPLSVSFACSVAIVTIILLEFHSPEFRKNIEANLLLSTVIVIMDMGTSEAVYLGTILRFLGSIIGIGLGLLIQIIIFQVDSGATARGPAVAGTIRLMALAPIIYLCAYYMRKYPRYQSVFLLTAINCPAVILSQRSYVALSVVIGTVVGSLAAIMTYVIFDRSSSDSFLVKTYSTTVQDVLSLIQAGLDRSRYEKQYIVILNTEIQKNMLMVRQTYKQYATWQSWLRLPTKHDFEPMYDSLCDLFFRSTVLAVDEQADDATHIYRGLIGAPVRCIVTSIDSIKMKLQDVFSGSIGPSERVTLLDDLVDSDLQDGIILHYEAILDAHFQFQTNEFRQQRFIMEISLCILALGNFMNLTTRTFLASEETERICTRINDSLEYLTLQWNRNMNNYA